MIDISQKKIALVGVSEDQYKYGHRIFKDMLSEGLKVRGINPKGGEIRGQKIYKSLRELGDRPDVVVTVVPPAVTESVVEECHELGVPEIWMQPGSESDAAIKKAKDYGIQVTHNTCIMVASGFW